MDLQRLAVAASKGLDPSRLHIINSQCSYYHYLCDGVDDRGWGCGYRSLQSLCSWVIERRKAAAALEIPSLHGIQEALVEVGDKPQTFLGSREWMGSFEVCLVLDHLYGEKVHFCKLGRDDNCYFLLNTKVACKIVHVSSGSDVVHHVPALVEHFTSIGAPVMIGGNIDAASKTLIGLVTDDSSENTRFLIADPHYCGGADEDSVLRDGFVKWHGLDLFESSSFYNFCLPQFSS